MNKKNVAASLDEASDLMKRRIDEDIDRFKAELDRDIDKAVDQAFAPLFWIPVVAGVAVAVIEMWSKL